MYHVNNNMYYVESSAEHIEEKHLSPSKTNVLEQFDENDRFRWRLKVTRTDKKDPRMLQLEQYKLLRVLSVAARLIG